MPEAVYAIAIAQFLLGAIISVLNLVLWLAVATNPRLRTAPQCLMGNMWFANLVLGVIVAISNVVDQSNVIVFEKTEGTIAIVNGFVTVSMLLALTTNRVCTIRNPAKAMSTKTAFKIITATWATVLVLTLIKAVVYGLGKIGITGAEIKTLLAFEVSMLVIFAAATLAIFFVSIYLICSHRNRTITDSSAPDTPPHPTPAASNYQKEYSMALTIGLLLFGFSLTFLAFVFTLPAYLIHGDDLDKTATEIIITLFYTHCIINPIIVLIRDGEMRKTARQILRCQRPNPSGQHQQNNSIRHQINQPTVEIDVHIPQSTTNQQQQGLQSNLRTVVHLPPIDAPIKGGESRLMENIHEETREYGDHHPNTPAPPSAPAFENEPKHHDV